MRSYVRFSVLALTVAGFQSTVCAQQGVELSSEPKQIALAQAASAAEQPEFAGDGTPAEFRKIWGYIFYAPGMLLYEYGPYKVQHVGAGVEWRAAPSFGVGLEGS